MIVVTTAQYKSKIESLAKFIVNYYISENVDFLIEITLLDYDLDGECVEHSQEYVEIFINQNLEFYELMLTVSHEMIHAKQYILGELTNDTWLGYDYRCSHSENHPEYPWEKEAYQLEEKMLNLWFKTCN